MFVFVSGVSFRGLVQLLWDPVAGGAGDALEHEPNPALQSSAVFASQKQAPSPLPA